MTPPIEVHPGTVRRHGRPVRLLLTGFGPFPGMPVNPTGRIVERIARQGLFGYPPVRLLARILPTEWDSLEEIERLIARHRPDAVLLTGVAGGAGLVRLERTARNRTGRTLADAQGRLPDERTLDDGAGRTVSRLAADLPAIARRLGSAGIPVRISDDAGAYLCNASYLVAERAAARLPGARPVLFLHVPTPRVARGRRPADLERAALLVARAIADRVSGARRAAGRASAP